MAVVFGKFEMPEKILVEESSQTFGRFIAEPFERGCGHTIGNSLRRMMLTSIEAPAIVSIAIEGIPHEYMACEGIIEDMTNVILNFKCALLRRLPLDEEQTTRGDHRLSVMLEVTEEDLKEAGQRKVTLKDLIKTELYELVNPDLHLLTVTKPMSKRIDIYIATGRGYVPSERHELENKIEGEIVIDSAFSPVTLVNYYVENTRVGQDTDYDRLILEVTTDGRMTPTQALSFASQITIKHLNVFEQLDIHAVKFEEEDKEKNTDRDEMVRKLSLRINEIELSVRSTNCLSSAHIQTIGELVVKPESDMLKYRNFGKKSLNEIKDKLHEMRLSLGMDLTRYSIHAGNVQAIIKEYEEEKNNI